ncbi:MAG: M15 family metallopeptidase [Dehalococcoidia bacterium]
MTLTPRLVIGVLIAVAVVGTFSACGDDDDVIATFSPGATRTATPSSPGATDQPTPVPGDTTIPSDIPDQTEPPSQVTLLSVVDKLHSLSPDYTPPELAPIPGDYLAPGFSGSLRQEALAALLQMLDTAFAAGHDIRARSAYRSYTEQEATFQYWVDTLGYDEAMRVSAMPGHSEHQLGTAVDLTSAEVGWELVESFGNAASGQWLADHSIEYGFVLSYPAGSEPVTGYAYEPWHFRYIGPASAADYAASNLYLNEYLLTQ